MKPLRGIQQERLFYIEFLALFTGRVSRKDLVLRFDISEPAATKDLSLYAKLAPDVLRYDIREKTYMLSKEKPCFSHNIEQSLYSLSGNRAIAVDHGHAKRLPSWVNLSIRREISLKLVTTITRCIYQNLKMKVKYHSLSSGDTNKLLTPLAIVNDGSRWHIRCYDHDKERFSDYNLTRFTEAKSNSTSSISLEEDPAWSNDVKLQLIPHPKSEHPETISMDFDLIENVKEVTLKSCLVGYFLRHWHIDYTNNATGNPRAQQLFLNNKQQLIEAGVPDWTFN